MEPIHKQFTDEQKVLVTKWFGEGKTHAEIGDLLGGIPRRTIGKLCKHLGLRRDPKEIGSLKVKSPLDSPEIIEKIRELRSTHSLDEIKAIVGGSIQSIHRLCIKYNIELDKEKYRDLQSNRMKNAWTDDRRESVRERVLKYYQDNPELRRRLSDNSKRLWDSDEYREGQIRIQREFWNRPENKRRLTDFRSKQSGILSNIQHTLYSILDDLNIKYYREYQDRESDPETIIGPYNFDCVIPRDGDRDLLIECHGDYWHSQDKAIRNDQAKQTYINRYHSDKYELKVLWEHEFLELNRVQEVIKYWLGITRVDIVDFDFSSVDIRKAPSADYRTLLSKYHYLPNAGRGGIAYGAYLDNNIVGVCVFSPLPRQNIDIDNYSKDEVRELSRLCIHPRYQKRNFASWFVSRCMKRLPNSFKCIVSYCDTTFNHNGAIYKALNFKQDRVVRPDYWYANKDGWVIHKKTLYGHAKKMSMKEVEYADKYGYKRVYGREKLRFIYER